MAAAFSVPEIKERCGSTAEAITGVVSVLRCSNFFSTSIPGPKSHVGERQFLPSLPLPLWPLSNDEMMERASLLV